MQRAGAVAQQTMDAAFQDADASDAEEAARVFARLRTAVEVAADVGGVRLTAVTQKRLAYLLQTLWFCGGTKREGSRAFISTLSRLTGNGRRTVDRLLQRARQLDLLHTWRSGRQTRNRVNAAWIAELVAHRQTGAPPAKAARKQAHHPPKQARRTTKLSCATPKTGAPIDNRVSCNEKLKGEALSWPELVELLGGEAALQAAIDALPENRRRLLATFRRRGEIPDWIVEPLLH